LDIIPIFMIFDMKKNAFRIVGLLLGVASSFLMSCSCERTSDNGAKPTVIITNLTAGGDTALAAGQSIKFELACNWNGSDALTNLIVSSNGARLVDEGFFKENYNKEVVFHQGYCCSKYLDFYDS